MKRIQLLLLGVLLLSLGPALAGDTQDENVIIVVLDDIGMDKTGAYGFLGTNGQPLAAKTPNIDRLARRGMLFRNAWAAPACSTCRAAAVTGKYPNRTGVGSRVPFNTPGSEGLLADEPTVADILPPHYVSGVVGKWHLGGAGPLGSPAGGIDHAPRCGFDFHLGTAANLGTVSTSYWTWTSVVSLLANLAATHELQHVNDYATTRTTTTALRAIEGLGDQPFFLWIAYNAVHKPHHIPPSHLYDATGLNLASNLGKVKAMIQALDTEIGRLFDEMDPEVLARTTVILFADNGTESVVSEEPWLPGKVKGTVYNGGIQVPFLVMSPRIPAPLRGSECERLIDITDLLPTVAEMFGVSAPSEVDGHSFLPYLSDPNAPQLRPWIYSERFRPNFVPQAGMTISDFPLELHDQAARESDYKLIRKWRLGTGGLPDTEEFEFYDVVNDFFETNDLLDAAGHPPAHLQTVYDSLEQILRRMAR